MSLLLDALKEAEARKREAGAVAAQAAPRAAPEAPSFEIDGALALAEDVPSGADAEPVPTGFAPGAVRQSPAIAASPATAIDPAAAALLAARAARKAAAPPTAGVAPVPAASVSSPAIPPTRPTGTDRPAPAASGGVAPAAAAKPVAASAAGTSMAANRRSLPWLVATGAVLALLLGGLFLLDASDETRVAPVPIAPVAPQPAASIATGGVPTTPEAQPSSAPGPAASTLARRATVREARDAVAAAPESAPARVATAPRSPPATAPPDPEPVRIAISRETAPLQAAWSALQAGDVARAEPLYRRVLEDEPGQVDAQLALAVIAQARGDDEAARRGYRRVLESVPDHPRAWGGLAELAGEGEAGAVESRLRQLLAAAPSAPLHFALGNLLSRQQRWDDAQVEYFAAASLAPQAPDYAFNVAVALERIGKSAAALSWYDRSLELVTGGRAARFDVAAVRARVAELQAAPP